MTDFGLALQQEVARLTVDGGIVGTPEYMSAEQAAGRTATARSDIYSLGVVAYELLTGRVPFEGDSPLMVLNKIQKTDPQWPRSITPAIPIDLENMIRKMMAKTPADRYASCQEIIQDAQKARGRQPVSQQVERSPVPRWLGGAAAALAVLLAAILAVVFVLTADNGRNGPDPGEPPRKGGSKLIPVKPKQFKFPTDKSLPKKSAEKNPVDPKVSARKPLPPFRLDNPEEMERALAVLETRLGSLKQDYLQGSRDSIEEDFDIVKVRFSMVESRMEDFHKAMYPDKLVLKKGDEMRGNIASESLQEVRFVMPLGLQEIPRDKIALTAYATDEERVLSAKLLQTSKNIDRFKKDVSSFQRALAAGQVEAPVEPADPSALQYRPLSDTPSDMTEESARGSEAGYANESAESG